MLTLGFSPCPNDTFMFDALVHDRIDTRGMEFRPEIADVETLNEWALEGKLDITKLSYHTYLKARDNYTLLRSGSALGFGCGPLVISKERVTEQDIIQGPVAIPGELTTAHMLFRLRYPDARNKQFVLFSDVEQMVLDGIVVAGVIIHENRFTYAGKGLKKVMDLGEYWEFETGTPIPLGAIVARNTLPKEQILAIEEVIADSVRFAFNHPRASEEYVSCHAAEMDPEVTRKHIETYVNEFSVDLGPLGLGAVSALEHRARESGII